MPPQTLISTSEIQAQVDLESTAAGRRATVARVLRRAGHSGIYSVETTPRGTTVYAWRQVQGAGCVQLHGTVVTSEGLQASPAPTTSGVRGDVQAEDHQEADPQGARLDTARLHREAVVLRLRTLQALRPENQDAVRTIAARLTLALLE